MAWEEEGKASRLVRRVISDSSKRNGLLARKTPNTAGANILATRYRRGRNVGGELNFR